MSTKANRAACMIAIPLLLFQVLACKTPLRRQPEEAVVTKDLDLVSEYEDLRTSIDRFLGALRSCTFSDEVRSRIPEPPNSWMEIESNPQQYCLARAELIEEKAEGPALAYFILSGPLAGRAGTRELYVVFARLIEDRWLMTWPAPQGPPLH